MNGRRSATQRPAGLAFVLATTATLWRFLDDGEFFLLGAIIAALSLTASSLSASLSTDGRNGSPPEEEAT